MTLTKREYLAGMILASRFATRNEQAFEDPASLENFCETSLELADTLLRVAKRTAPEIDPLTGLCRHKHTQARHSGGWTENQCADCGSICREG